MKAKIKKTGEIINIAEYSKITLECYNSWGNLLELKLEEVELIQEQTEDEHLQNVRERAAIAAMQGTIMILSNRTAFGDIVVEGFRGDEKTYPNEIAEFAMSCADSLIKELKKEINL